MREVVIVDAIRSPLGRRGGTLSKNHPIDASAFILNALKERNNLDPETVDHVIYGCVSEVGAQSTNLGRNSVLTAGWPYTVPAATLDQQCSSSQQAVHFAAQAIAAGDARYAIGCGVESMTRVRMFFDIDPDGRHGGFGGLNPALFERHELVHQGESAERVADRWRLSRAALDEFATESHRRAWAALAHGRNRELVPIAGVDEAGRPVELVRDEGVRERIDAAKLATLKTVFRENGTITAGNSSQISDGAAAVLVADRAAAQADGLRPRARFLARVVVGSDPTLQLDGVIPATRLALERARVSVADVDWFEVNEAFACVPLAWAREFAPAPEKLNPWGGAIAHGHPLGATGAGLMAKMLAGLEATGGTIGLQTMCIGHGMATATIVERI